MPDPKSLAQLLTVSHVVLDVASDNNLGLLS